MRTETAEITAALLVWYKTHARILPWRSRGRSKPDPYRVWLSEIMLQQTTVSAVIPYYAKFLKLWPDIRALACSSEQDILQAWAGLGYYARARNLHACARRIAGEHGGKFPVTEAGLLALPGIGAYTAAAIAAIAFHQKTAPVDGNIERVAIRLFAIREPKAKAKSAIQSLMNGLYAHCAPAQVGDMAQALMDLAGAVCKPKTPQCAICPVAKFCRARKQGIAAQLPARSANKKPRPVRYAYAYVIHNKGRGVLMERRPAKGLLGGTLGFPLSESVLHVKDRVHAPSLQALLKSRAATELPEIRHTFSHFDLVLKPVLYNIDKGFSMPPPACAWKKIPRPGDLPSLFRKVLEAWREHT